MRGHAGVGIISVRVSQSVANRNTAEVSLLVTGDTPVFVEGQPVEIGNGAVQYFVGTIETPRRQWLNPSAVVQSGAAVETTWTLPCVSYDQIANRRLVEITQVYANQTAGYIVRNLATQFLGGENMGLGGVEDGPTFESVTVEAGTTVYAAFDSIAERAGMFWDILGVVYFPQLRLYSRSSLSSEITLDRNSPLIIQGEGDGGIAVEIDRRQVANEIWAELQNGPGPATAQDFGGDGSSREFQLDKPMDGQPRIFVNGVEKAVAPEDYIAADWYYRPGSNTVRQDDTQTVLGVSDLLHVEYTPRERIVVLGAKDDANIAVRAGTEGGSGRYQFLIQAADGATITDVPIAAQAVLAALKNAAKRAYLRFIHPLAEGLGIGQTAIVDLPEVGLDSQTLFIEAVERRFFGKTLDTGEDVIMHQFTMSSGGVLGDWATLLSSAWSVGASGSATAAGVISGGSGAGATVQDLGELTADTTVTPSPSSPSSGDLLVVAWTLGTTVYSLTWGTGFAGTAQAAYRPRTPSKHFYLFLFAQGQWNLIAWRTDT